MPTGPIHICIELDHPSINDIALDPTITDSKTRRQSRWFARVKASMRLLFSPFFSVVQRSGDDNVAHESETSTTTHIFFIHW